MFSGKFWLHEIQITNEKNNILGGSSPIDRSLNLHFVFTIFWQEKTYEKNLCENGFFYIVFSCSSDTLYNTIEILRDRNKEMAFLSFLARDTSTLDKGNATAVIGRTHVVTDLQPTVAVLEP